MLNFCDFIQVFVFTRNHHLKAFSFDVSFNLADYRFLPCYEIEDI